MVVTKIEKLMQELKIENASYQSLEILPKIDKLHQTIRIQLKEKENKEKEQIQTLEKWDTLQPSLEKIEMLKKQNSELEVYRFYIQYLTMIRL